MPEFGNVPQCPDCGGYRDDGARRCRCGSYAAPLLIKVALPAPEPFSGCVRPCVSCGTPFQTTRQRRMLCAYCFKKREIEA